MRCSHMIAKRTNPSNLWIARWSQFTRGFRRWFTSTRQFNRCETIVGPPVWIAMWFNRQFTWRCNRQSWRCWGSDPRGHSQCCSAGGNHLLDRHIFLLSVNYLMNCHWPSVGVAKHVNYPWNDILIHRFSRVTWWSTGSFIRWNGTLLLKGTIH